MTKHAKKSPVSMEPQEFFTDEEQSLRQYWDVYRRYKAIFISITLTILGIGLYYGYSAPDRYESSVELKKPSGFKRARQVISSPNFRGNQAEDIATVANSIDARRRAVAIFKNKISNNDTKGRTLSSSDLAVADTITPGILAAYHELEINTDFDSSAALVVRVPESGLVAAVLADAYAEALAEVANNVIAQSLKAKETMLLQLQDDKQKEVKDLEDRLNAIRNARMKKGVAFAYFDKKNIVNLLSAAEVELQKNKLDLEMLIKGDTYLRESFGVTADEDVTKIEWRYNEEPLHKKLKALKSQREEYRTRYTDKNPIVRKLDKRIESVESVLMSKNEEGRVIYVAPANRAHVNILMRNKIRSDYLRSKIEGLADRIKGYKKELLAEPDLKAKIINDEIIVLNRIINDLRKEYQQLKITTSSNFNRIKVISKSSVPSLPLPNSRVKVGLFSFFVGLLIASMAVFVLNGWSNTVLNSSDLKRHIDYPVLGVIPYWDNKSAYINPDEPDSSIGEIYSVLRNNIKYSSQVDPSSCLMVASAVQNEGKSHTSINLATSFALEGNSVLLMTVDLRTERSYAKLRRPDDDRSNFGKGLSDYLQGDLPKEDLIFASRIDNLFVVPSGPKAKNPTYLLRSDKCVDLINQAKSHFDVIIVDAPASLPVVDSAVVSNLVDGVLMVVEAGKTPVNVIEQAIARLEHVNSPIIGAVVNKVRDLGLDSFYGSGYSYYPNYYRSSYRAGYKATYKSTYTSNTDAT